MQDTLFWSRLQFAFTITYHYLFPQLTMGLAWIIVCFKWRHLRTGEERFGHAARFWARIFGINFAIGIVTGIPMEFQFGTNWAEFSKFSGNIIGQTLAMEGMFAFFLESAMVGAMIWGEKRLGPRNHFLATVGVARFGFQPRRHPERLRYVHLDLAMTGKAAPSGRRKPRHFPSATSRRWLRALSQPRATALRKTRSAF